MLRDTVSIVCLSSDHSDLPLQPRSLSRISRSALAKDFGPKEFDGTNSKDIDQTAQLLAQSDLSGCCSHMLELLFYQSAT